ncbi:hypothetical protein KO498_10660 [Lentibacter algarum]|uniref:hypothetical protein n=1 Tax=Lentibacter algarum TaxID=576131 RepID=UPI001C06E945|nr:hypothetical protein [Lentibacter algarum]MBU2982267.1 hypothetical protein [Lentibacter algarum]
MKKIDRLLQRISSTVSDETASASKVEILIGHAAQFHSNMLEPQLARLQIEEAKNLLEIASMDTCHRLRERHQCPSWWRAIPSMGFTPLAPTRAQLDLFS